MRAVLLETPYWARTNTDGDRSLTFTQPWLMNQFEKTLPAFTHRMRRRQSSGFNFFAADLRIWKHNPA
jgi:hypothetical protein